MIPMERKNWIPGKGGQIIVNGESLEQFVPEELREVENPQTELPRIAKDVNLLARIEHSLHQIPTAHNLLLQDSRLLDLKPENVHLVVTSPPYWTLKRYNEHDRWETSPATNNSWTNSTRSGRVAMKPSFPEDG